MIKATRYNNRTRDVFGGKKCVSYGDIVVKKKKMILFLKLAISKMRNKTKGKLKMDI